jgi:hypothetical protein
MRRKGEAQRLRVPLGSASTHIMSARGTGAQTVGGTRTEHERIVSDQNRGSLLWQLERRDTAQGNLNWTRDAEQHYVSERLAAIEKAEADEATRQMEAAAEQGNWRQRLATPCWLLAPPTWQEQPLDFSAIPRCGEGEASVMAMLKSEWATNGKAAMSERFKHYLVDRGCACPSGRDLEWLQACD